MKVKNLNQERNAVPFFRDRIRTALSEAEHANHFMPLGQHMKRLEDWFLKFLSQG